MAFFTNSNITTGTVALGTNTVMLNPATIYIDAPIQWQSGSAPTPPKPLTEIERLLADVDAVCALARVP